MAACEYFTDVITRGLLGRKEEELDGKRLEKPLNEYGAQGWELTKVILDVALHHEKDGHVLIFKRATA
jgi:hypothetical protein